MGRNPWVPLAPFGPIPMRPKGAKGAFNQPQKPGPKLAVKSAYVLWKQSEDNRSTLRKDCPLAQGKTSLPSMHSLLKEQEWCIHGIMYHYAPFLLSNPMVTLPGPNYMIPNQVPNPSPILKEDFSAIQSGNSLEATRRPFKDPNHLALQELGFQFSPGLS
ncbi:hypothetical protein O181_011818 [Austropuccinia psidii MF-1]|uniref:Uncharacterized protein n=1 Tax=Austropuccinia psidii MF-1 TaxID=1389203 RepID=A0A9Q3GLM3_9BASI|nr:hypothetical protein [Austropuccinia psidii MF-1]